ncbi:MAG: hypothetical protein OEZ32_12690 [Nitrospinota bacterium]|nr:hypothetical protein [Nitrospinota bacterium]
MLVVDAASEGEGLEAGVRVLGNIPKFVVVDALGYGAIRRIDNKSHGAQMVTYNPIRHAALDHVVGHMALAGIDESGDNIPRAVQFGDWFQLILVDEAQ